MAQRGRKRAGWQQVAEAKTKTPRSKVQRSCNQNHMELHPLTCFFPLLLLLLLYLNSNSMLLFFFFPEHNFLKQTEVSYSAHGTQQASLKFALEYCSLLTEINRQHMRTLPWVRQLKQNPVAFHHTSWIYSKIGLVTTHRTLLCTRTMSYLLKFGKGNSKVGLFQE